MVDLKYLGHSAFQITNGENALLIDPFIEGNKKYDYKKQPITDILLTHAHSDHLGQAIEIAKEKDIEITAVFELANYCKSQGAKVKPIGLGSWINYSWGRAVFLPAFHSSSLPDGSYGGCAAGIFLDVNGSRIYHAGDTCLTGEMKTIKEAIEAGAKKVVAIKKDDTPSLPEIKQVIKDFSELDYSIFD